MLADFGAFRPWSPGRGGMSAFPDQALNQGLLKSYRSIIRTTLRKFIKEPYGQICSMRCEH